MEGTCGDFGTDLGWVLGAILVYLGVDSSSNRSCYAFSSAIIAGHDKRNPNNSIGPRFNGYVLQILEFCVCWGNLYESLCCKIGGA